MDCPNELLAMSIIACFGSCVPSNLVRTFLSPWRSQSPIDLTAVVREELFLVLDVFEFSSLLLNAFCHELGDKRHELIKLCQSSGKHRHYLQLRHLLTGLVFGRFGHGTLTDLIANFWALQQSKRLFPIDLVYFRLRMVSRWILCSLMLSSTNVILFVTTTSIVAFSSQRHDTISTVSSPNESG